MEVSRQETGKVLAFPLTITTGPIAPKDTPLDE